MSVLLEEHAIEKAGQGPLWAVCYWACQPMGVHPALYYELRGGVFPPIKRGARKGQPNFSGKVEDGSYITVVITPAEHATWLDRWEAKTGKCRHCAGEGKTVARISVNAPTEYRTCRKCNGTGKKWHLPNDKRGTDDAENLQRS